MELHGNLALECNEPLILLDGLITTSSHKEGMFSKFLIQNK